MSRPVLSFILCSRNDNYMGNSRWRLETALNYVAAEIQALGREADVEILVTDWGSESPLHEAVRLTPAAARLTTFLLVPPDRARSLQRDSPFAEVFALNIAARRARGTYIGRVDQDTLVGRRFLSVFFDIVEGRHSTATRLQMGFSNIKMIPYRLAVLCPSSSSVALFIHWFGRRIRRQNEHSRAPYYDMAVGIWLLHRDVWAECGGYDERMIYMNSMEINMTRRLLPKYTMVNLGELSGWDFYHLEHYHPWMQRSSSVFRKTNNDPRFTSPEPVNPNGEDWGLPTEVVEMQRATPAATEAGRRPLARVAFLLLLVRVGAAVSGDVIGLALRHRWNRLLRAREMVRGRPLTAWPGVIQQRRQERKAGRLQTKRRA